MRIEYQISEDDFVSAAKLAMRKRSAFAGYRIYIWPVLGAVLILFGAVAAIGKRDVSGLWPRDALGIDSAGSSNVVGISVSARL